MDTSFLQDLDQVLGACSQQPLQKANHWLLQRACILCTFSLDVYEFNKISAAQQACLGSPLPTTSFSTSPDTRVEATLLSGPIDSLPVHAIWEVKDLGVVVAFQGTDNLLDWFTNLNFEPVQLASSSSRLHGGIHTAAARSLPAIHAAYAKAAQNSNSGKVPLYLTGHSLGGGYALCTFLQLLASADDLSSSILLGGVYTFGAPLVASPDDASQAIQMMYREQHQAASANSPLPVYNFVNGLDSVPRLLGDSSIYTLAKALGITMMPLGLLLHRAASVAGGFAPFGTYCLMLSDAISVIDSIAQPKLLQTTGAQLFKVVQNVGESRGAAPLIVQRFLTDHDIQSYKDVLQNVLQNPSALGDSDSVPQGFFKLRSLVRQHRGLSEQYLCLDGPAEIVKRFHIGHRVLAVVWLIAPVPNHPSAITLTVSQLSSHLYVSASGREESVSLIPKDGTHNMIWSAKPGKQAGEWHFSVLAGNSSDASRIQLSCGLDDGYEHVDLWHDHCWELEKVSNSSMHSGDCPEGFFRMKSVARRDSGRHQQYLGLQHKAEPSGRFQIVTQDAAVILNLVAVPHHQNAVSMLVIPQGPTLYMSVPCDQPAVDLWHSQDGSGRQIWVASRTHEGQGWQLSVSGGHHDGQGRHTLSCGLDAGQNHVDLWTRQTWIMEEASSDMSRRMLGSHMDCS